MRTLTLLCGMLAAGVASASLSRAGDASFDDEASRQVRAHTSFLADDLLEGRGTGTRGHELAARYVASHFLRMGLQPAGGSTGFEQTVPLIEVADQIDAGKLIVRRPDRADVSLEAVKDAIVRVAPGQTAGSTTAAAVFVGYGVHAPEFDYDDFAGIDLTGKVAVVLSGAPPLLPPDPRAYFASEKLRTLAQRGAIGVITVITPRDLARGPWAMVAAQSRFPRMRLLNAAGGIVDGFPELRVNAVVNPASAHALFDGTAHTADALFAAGEKSTPPHFELGATVELQASASFKPLHSVNVLGLLPGTDPSRAGEAIVVTAHLDHLGIGPAVAGDTLYNGAMDNAIGTGVLLAMAERLATLPRSRRPILFAAVTAEEKGLLGAQHLSLNPPAGVQRYVANLNFDMPLFSVTTRELVGWGSLHSTLGATLTDVAHRQQFTVVADPIPDEAIFVRSDQYAFIRRGVPSLFLSTWPTVDPASPQSPDPSGVFLGERYHKPSDDVNQPIDWPSTGAFARVSLDFVRTLADAPDDPAWLSGNFFGRAFRRPSH